MPNEQQRWRTSSYSGASGNTNCVEVSWRKSSHSGHPNTDCVEVAFAVDAVGVRDSKNTTGPRLAFTANTWRAFAHQVPSA
jgi:hypothetical protein